MKFAYQESLHFPLLPLVAFLLLSACAPRLTLYQLINTEATSSIDQTVPRICDLNVADGQFVKIVQDCSGKFHFLPYHLSTNTQYNAVSSSSVFLDDYARYALYSFRLEITPMAWNEAQNLSQSLGQHAITPYPYNYVEIIPLTFFARRRDIIISYAPHISRQSAIYSTNLYIQVHGEHNIDTLAQFLAQSASILFEQRIGLTIEDETQVITTIQLKIGSLRQSNVTQ